MEGRWPDDALREVLHVPFSESVAAAVSEAASSLLHRWNGESGNHRNRSRAGLRLLVRLRASGTNLRTECETPGSRRTLWTHDASRSATASDLCLCRRNPGAGGEGIQCPSSAFLRGLRPQHAAMAEPARVRVDRSVEDSCGRSRQAAWRI